MKYTYDYKILSLINKESLEVTCFLQPLKSGEKKLTYLSNWKLNKIVRD